MRALVYFVIIAAAGFLGYSFEPNLRLELTGISHIAPQPKPQPGNQEEQILSKVDIGRYVLEQLPKEVLLKKPTEVADTTSGVKMTIPAGTKVKLVRIGAGTLIISPGLPTVEGEVEVQDTDIREQIISNPPPALDPKAVAANPATGENPPADAMAKNEPAGDSMTGASPDKPADTAANDPAMNEPTEGSNPALAPEKAPDAAATAEFSSMTPDDIVKAMQDSVKGGQITSFKFEDASEWTAGEPEEVDGKKFNTGLVSYQGKTFLGVKTIQGKAYIAGGKVIRWVNPRSGTELK